MAENSQTDTAPFVVTNVRDAAGPISEALLPIYEGRRGGFRVRDVTFVYSDDGVTITVSPELDTDTREEMYGHFIDAFRAAGWGFSTRLNREMTYRQSIAFRPPAQLTRLGG